MKRYQDNSVGTLIDIYDPLPTPPEPTQTVMLYTGCSRDEVTKAGGWAAIIVAADGQVQTLAGSEIKTNSYRLEVVAALHALKALQEPTLVRLVVRDDYLFNGMTKWIHDWVSNGWREIKHQDVWKQVAEQLGKHTISPDRQYPAENDPYKRQAQALARSKAGESYYH